MKEIARDRTLAFSSLAGTSVSKFEIVNGSDSERSEGLGDTCRSRYETAMDCRLISLRLRAYKLFSIDSTGHLQK